MKIEVELVSRQRGDRPSMDIEVAVAVNDTESEVIRHAGIQLAHPTTGHTSTRDMLRHLFGTQGDLYRDLGVRNYKTFQPDFNYFNSSSEGWQRFVTRVAADTAREETLKRLAQLIGSRIRLFTQVFPPAVYEVGVAGEMPPIGISVGDLAPNNMEIRLGGKIYRATAVEDNQTTLLATAVKEVKEGAAAKVAGLQTECSKGLEMLKTQYERKMDALEQKYAHILEAPTLSSKMLHEGALYSANPAEREHVFYIPMKLHILYVQGRNLNVRWTLKDKYQLKQKVWLKITTDPKLNVKNGKLLDTKFRDTVQQWHCSGGNICWGSYSPKLTCVEDLIKLRNDIASIMATINLQSIGARNLHGIQDEMYRYMRNTSDRFRDPGMDYEEWDIKGVADRIKTDTTGAWTTGDAWST